MTNKTETRIGDHTLPLNISWMSWVLPRVSRTKLVSNISVFILNLIVPIRGPRSASGVQFLFCHEIECISDFKTALFIEDLRQEYSSED